MKLIKINTNQAYKSDKDVQRCYKRRFYTKDLVKKLSQKQLEIINHRLKNTILDLNTIVVMYRNMYYRCYEDANHASHKEYINLT